MHNIGMYETAGDKSIPLVLIANGRRIKDQVIGNLFIRKSRKRYHTGNKYDGNGYT